MNELGIIHIREIIRTIKNKHNCDFSSYALTSFKYRLERLMMKYNIQFPEHLIKKIQDEPDFFNNFLYDISIPSTEMFRDPSLWRWLREEYFSQIISMNTGKFKIWLPACVSGGELYSLVILLHEMELLDNVKIIATSISSTSIDMIKTGQYDLKKITISEENYYRANGINELSKYYTIDRYYAYRDTTLIEDVEFHKVNITFDDAPQNVKLILFRNSLIYYNPSHQEKVLRTLHGSLSSSGHLIIGIKENNTFQAFEAINNLESVYKKKYGS